ncbi:hypothetical protein [Solirhodobacter olei]|uniref:hypothetical protein n=1 Tax=Solirhodobacter olei TaxID=2493082 RepID=UPI000FDC0FF4|nr:hypothetical protein [Solirhodobacter olei]
MTKLRMLPLTTAAAAAIALSGFAAAPARADDGTFIKLLAGAAAVAIIANAANGGEHRHTVAYRDARPMPEPRFRERDRRDWWRHRDWRDHRDWH